jgi:hypothetical protein
LERRTYNQEGLHLRCCTVAAQRSQIYLGSCVSYCVFCLQNVALRRWAMLVSNQRPLPCEVCRAGPNTPCSIRTCTILTPISPSAWSMFSCRFLLFSTPVAAWLQHTVPFRVEDQRRVGHKRRADSVVEIPDRVDARHRRRGRAALGVARVTTPTRGTGGSTGSAPRRRPARATLPRAQGWPS